MDIGGICWLQTIWTASTAAFEWTLSGFVWIHAGPGRGFTKHNCFAFNGHLAFPEPSSFGPKDQTSSQWSMSSWHKDWFWQKRSRSRLVGFCFLMFFCWFSWLVSVFLWIFMDNHYQLITITMIHDIGITKARRAAPVSRGEPLAASFLPHAHFSHRCLADASGGVRLGVPS